MARLPDRSSRFMLIATFIICSSILFVDFRFDTFKPVQNFYNSSSIFIRVFSSEYVVRPLYRSLSSMRDTRRAKEENKNLKEEDIKNFCKNEIAHFKIPARIKFVEEFPMTVSGKIKKFEMRDAMIKELGLETAATA